jgi:glycosyltransferase involved in cell wall biosynthesis
MKKIVIDAREYSSSTGRYVRKLLEYLVQVDTDLSHKYVVLLKPKDMDSYQPKSKRFTKQVCRWKEFGFGEQIGLAWQLYRLRPDIVHFGMTQQPLLYFGKTITTIHDLTTTRFRNPSKNKWVFKIKQQIYIVMTKIVARKSAVIITPTEFVREDVAKFANINSRKIIATHEAVDPFDEKEEEIPELVGKEFIIFNGRPLPHKNLRRLMKAFALVHNDKPDLQLVIAGKKDASFRSYERLAKRLEIIDSVLFTDFIPDSQLAWALSNAKAYVYPSLSEGFGLPGLEAMQYGTPLISSKATCLPEVYGDSAEYFDPRDVADMAAKIQKVLGSEKRQKELVALGKKQITKYSWKRMSEQTRDIYKTVLHEEHVS